MTDAPQDFEPEEDRRTGHGRRDDDKTIEVQVKERVLTPTFLLLCASVILSSAGLLGIFVVLDHERDRTSKLEEVAEDTNRVVTDLEQRESPEGRAAREEALDQIILEVDCNTRLTLDDFAEQFITELQANGILPEGTTVTVRIPPECEPFLLPGG